MNKLQDKETPEQDPMWLNETGWEDAIDWELLKES